MKTEHENQYAIQVENLSKSFSEKKVLKQVSFRIEPGNVLGFLGPNGAGKTTTIKILLGLLKPDQGEIKVLGQNSNKLLTEHKKKLAYVPEKDFLYDFLTVREHIKLNQSFYEKWDEKLVTKYLQQFELSPEKKCSTLSQGEKKQLSLILALGGQPEIIIMDEPGSGLDPLKRQKLIEIIIKEMAVQNKTVLLSSHLLNVVEQVADKVVIINQGQVTEIRPVDELKENVKKIRVVFQREPDQDIFEQQGIKNIQKQGKEYLISVEDNLNQILTRIQQEAIFALDIVDQNLEQIFIQQVKEENK